MRCFWAAGWVALMALTACFAPSYSDETRCSSKGECPAGRTCHEGLCLSAAPPDAAIAPSDDAAIPDGPASPGDAPIPDAPPMADARTTATITITKSRGPQVDGTITTDFGVSCGLGCTTTSKVVPLEKLVSITAAPSADNLFAGWSEP